MNSINNNDVKITVVDAIMGSGKTSWGYQYIDENPDENILYITPFLKEIDRVISSTKRDFKQPKNLGQGKLPSLNNLLMACEDVASTHELFKGIDNNTLNYIRDGNYTLILDEVLNVIEPYQVNKNDIQILKDSQCISIDKDGFINWNQDKKDYDTKYNDIKLLAESKSLLLVNDVLLLWRYPPEVFKLFNKVYILTYLFSGSILKYYFDLNNISYRISSLKNVNGKYELCKYYYPDTFKYNRLITIHMGNLNNNFTQKNSSLSLTWFRANNKPHISQIRKNLYNYFNNILKTKVETIMWTTFKDFKSKLKGKGYSKSFVSCSCRSTNDYADTYNLAYCLNVYLHPAISQYFSQHGINVNQDLYALSEMLQWIWRSRIRKNEPINIYIASGRMRSLLIKWLEFDKELKLAS